MRLEKRSERIEMEGRRRLIAFCGRLPRFRSHDRQAQCEEGEREFFELEILDQQLKNERQSNPALDLRVLLLTVDICLRSSSGKRCTAYSFPVIICPPEAGTGTPSERFANCTCYTERLVISCRFAGSLSCRRIGCQGKRQERRRGCKVV